MCNLISLLFFFGEIKIRKVGCSQQSWHLYDSFHPISGVVTWLKKKQTNHLPPPFFQLFCPWSQVTIRCHLSKWNSTLQYFIQIVRETKLFLLFTLVFWLFVSYNIQFMPMATSAYRSSIPPEMTLRCTNKLLNAGVPFKVLRRLSSVWFRCLQVSTYAFVSLIKSLISIFRTELGKWR